MLRGRCLDFIMVVTSKRIVQTNNFSSLATNDDRAGMVETANKKILLSIDRVIHFGDSYQSTMGPGISGMDLLRKVIDIGWGINKYARIA